jgi:hypothetical protein
MMLACVPRRNSGSFKRYHDTKYISKQKQQKKHQWAGEGENPLHHLAKKKKNLAKKRIPYI